ncbi:hypothetical protein FWG95_02190 [Candidatus Saccharibacteria bacterium]|nr:hypothetical protein [Candidatus Saccharibacteria bacterium]
MRAEKNSKNPPTIMYSRSQIVRTTSADCSGFFTVANTAKITASQIMYCLTLAGMMLPFW